ncbi:MAG: hypothetical protein ACREGD_03685 [Candidatus Saccharimonadales bacterium]
MELQKSTVDIQPVALPEVRGWQPTTLDRLSVLALQGAATTLTNAEVPSVNLEGENPPLPKREPDPGRPNPGTTPKTPPKDPSPGRKEPSPLRKPKLAVESL